jgi:hypothetical protein
MLPIHTALRGFSIGDELEWPQPGGGMSTVRVIEFRNRACSRRLGSMTRRSASTLGRPPLVKSPADGQTRPAQFARPVAFPNLRRLIPQRIAQAEIAHIRNHT